MVQWKAKSWKVLWLFLSSKFQSNIEKGLLGGLWVVWLARPAFKKMERLNPRFVYQPYFSGLLKVSIVVAGYLAGDYFATSHLRRGANEPFSSLYNNNLYLKTKEQFMYNYSAFRS